MEEKHDQCVLNPSKELIDRLINISLCMRINENIIITAICNIQGCAQHQIV